MDDRVQQCPNCGAAVLPSARFCVTCGIRLPDPAGTSGSAGNAAPSGWSQPAEDVWIGEAPALAGNPAPELTGDRSQADAVPPSDQPAGGDGAIIALPAIGPAAHDRRSADDTGGGRDFAPANDQPAPDSDRPAPDDGVPAPAGDGWDSPAAEEAEKSELEQVGPEGELVDLSAASTGRDAAPDSDESPDAWSTDATATDRSLTDLPLEPDDFEPAGWDATDEDDDEPGRADPSADRSEGAGMILSSRESDPSPQANAAANQASSDLDRATHLLDEMRALLPRLVAPTIQTSAAVDLNALRERAVAARGSGSGHDFDALRDVITDAVNRPRDIEAVLRLSQRIDDIDLLLRERDRLDAALGDLIEGLSRAD